MCWGSSCKSCRQDVLTMLRLWIYQWCGIIWLWQVQIKPPPWAGKCTVKMPLVIIYAKCCREPWMAALLCISLVKHFGFLQQCGISAGETYPSCLLSKSCSQVLLPRGLHDWQSECIQSWREWEQTCFFTYFGVFIFLEGGYELLQSVM